jgi:hypothetical protein
MITGNLLRHVLDGFCEFYKHQSMISVRGCISMDELSCLDIFIILPFSFKNPHNPPLSSCSLPIKNYIVLLFPDLSSLHHPISNLLAPFKLPPLDHEIGRAKLVNL